MRMRSGLNIRTNTTNERTDHCIVTMLIISYDRKRMIDIGEKRMGKGRMSMRMLGNMVDWIGRHMRRGMVLDGYGRHRWRVRGNGRGCVRWGWDTNVMKW